MFTGVLFCAAPLFAQLPAAADPTLDKGELQWFHLGESRADVAKQLGLPRMVAPVGADFEAWQYQLGEVEEEGYSHHLVFRKSTGELISVARNYFPERTVDTWFPADKTEVHFYPSKDKPEFSVRLRKLPGDRFLLAMGTSKPGQVTGQIFLIREAELAAFYPWLAAQLKASATR